MHASKANRQPQALASTGLKCGRPDGGSTHSFATGLRGAESAFGVQGKAKSVTAPLVQRLGAANY